MMRRALTLVVAVVIVAAGPLPVSACALIANLAADCQPQPDCHSVPASPADSTLATGSGHDCCVLSDAPPLPAKEKEATVPLVVLQPAAQPSEWLAVSVADDLADTSHPIVCPSNLQACLCVLLI